MLIILMMTAAGARDVREIAGLEIRGLKLLSRHEILAGVTMKATAKGMLIDIDSLKSSLAKNGMIEESAVEAGGDRITVTVKERLPVYLLAVRRGKELIPFEADARMSILSVRTVHLADRPLVVLGEQDLRGGVISSRARDFLNEMGRLEENHEEIFREIAEIALGNDNMLEIFLKGRKTRIILPHDGRSFLNLKYIVSLFDGRNYYPGTLRIGDGYGVIE